MEKKLIVYIEPYANCKSLEISLLFVQKHSTQHVFRILDKFFYIFIHKIMFSAANECVFLLFAFMCVRVLFSQVNTIESHVCLRLSNEPTILHAKIYLFISAEKNGKQSANSKPIIVKKIGRNFHNFIEDLQFLTFSSAQLQMTCSFVGSNISRKLKYNLSVER